MAALTAEDVDFDSDEEAEEDNDGNMAVIEAYAEAIDEATRKRKREETELDAEYTKLQQELVQQGYQEAFDGGVDTQSASHGRLLELQVQAHLDVLPHFVHEHDTHLHSALHALESQLQQLKGTELDWAAAQGFCSDVGVGTQLQDSVTMQTPPRLSVLEAVRTGSSLHADVALHLPQELFKEKDHLNHRYHAKRAAYLATAVKLLQKLPQVSTVVWTCWRLDGRRPVALIHYTPPAAGKAAARISARDPAAPRTAGTTSPEALVLQLVPCCPIAAFKLQRLAPDRNSLRTVQLGVTVKAGATAGPTDGKAGTPDDWLPSPVYNHGILEVVLLLDYCMQAHSVTGDMMMAGHAEAVKGTLPIGGTAARAAMLLRHWLQVQGLAALGGSRKPEAVGAERPGHVSEGVVDGLTDEAAAAVVLLLMQQEKLIEAMTPLQMLRVLLQHLASTKLWLKGQQLRQQATESGSSFLASFPEPPSMATWHKQHEVVFLDGSGWRNLTAGMTKAYLALLSESALRCVTTLSAPSTWPEDVFATLFLRPTSLLQRADYWFTVVPPLSTAAPGCSMSSEGPASREAAGKGAGKRKKTKPSNGISGASPSAGAAAVPYFAADAPPGRTFQQQVSTLAARGLGDRAVTCHAGPMMGSVAQSAAVSVHATAGCSPAEGAAQLLPEHGSVLLCIRAVSGNAMRMLDIGPDAEDKAEVKRFRQFWGNKAELRRFKDGRICEAVVWERPPGQRHVIPDDIIHYTLSRHLRPGIRICCFAGALDSTVTLRDLPVEHAAAARQLLDAAFEKLQKTLLALKDDVPLSLVSVQPISGHLRRTEALPLVPHPLAGAQGAFQLEPGESPPRCLRVIDVCCRMEGSGRWPHDHVGYLTTKKLMAAHIASSLCSSLGMQAYASHAGTVDLLLEGFAFRLHFLSDRDEVVEQAAQQDASPATPGASSHPGAPHCLSASQLQKETWLHGLVAGVAGQYPSFAPACALGARWLHGHHMGSYVSQQALELLMVAVYKDVLLPWGPPASPLCGFLGLMQLLGSYPFRDRPLVVDVDAELSAQQLQEAWKEFQSRREGGAMPGMCIVTPAEPLGSQWTTVHPSALVISRIAALARRTLAATLRLTADMSGASDSGPEQADWRALVCSPFSDYDVLLLLEPAAVAAQQLHPGSFAKGRRSRQAKTADGVAGSRQLALLDDAGLLGKVHVSDPQQCTAVVVCIPALTIAHKGPQKLRQELLLGFDPVTAFVDALRARYGQVASFFWDADCPTALGVKWQPAALKAHPFDAKLAHMMRPISSEGGADGQTDAAGEHDRPNGGIAGKRSRKAKQVGQRRGARAWDGMVELDVVRVVAEMVEVGLGLVHEVQ